MHLTFLAMCIQCREWAFPCYLCLTSVCIAPSTSSMLRKDVKIWYSGTGVRCWSYVTLKSSHVGITFMVLDWLSVWLLSNLVQLTMFNVVNEMIKVLQLHHYFTSLRLLPLDLSLTKCLHYKLVWPCTGKNFLWRSLFGLWRRSPLLTTLLFLYLDQSGPSWRTSFIRFVDKRPY